MLVAFNGWAQKAAAHDEQVSAQIQAAERASRRGPYTNDGTFTGTAVGFGGDVTVEVRIVDGYIDAVDVVDASHEDDAWLEEALVLPERIMREQTSNIDVVSGATYTSAGILNATTQALQTSMGKQSS